MRIHYWLCSTGGATRVLEGKEVDKVAEICGQIGSAIGKLREGVQVAGHNVVFPES